MTLRPGVSEAYGAGMRGIRTLTVTALLTATAPTGVAAPAVALDVPEPPASGNVADLADVLTDEEEQQVAERIDAGNESTENARVAVLTVPSLEGEELEDFSRRVATEWGVGEAGKDNGVLVLQAAEEREVRVEVADGARQHVSDDEAEQVVDVMTGRFGDDDVVGGYTEGINDLYALARDENPYAMSTGEKVAAWVGGALATLALGLLAFFGVRSARRAAANEAKEKELTQQLIAEARAQDPELPEPDEEELEAFHRYRKEHQGQPLPGGVPLTYAAWLPLYAAAPTQYGAVDPASTTTPTSSFGGGGGFTGGGASGSY